MPPQPKQRLDQLLVERGLADSCERAQRLILAGQVRLGTDILDKPGHRFPADAAIVLECLSDRFVSRGGWKLEGAFEAWRALTPCPEVCADIGASTGGFTDCLLQHGARRVYAIDVGHGQLVPKMRNDPRVVTLERTNARFLVAGSLPEPMDLVVSDVSFISLTLILGPAVRILRPDGLGQAVVLVKPQFEAERELVGQGGVVRDPRVHRDVLRRIALEFPPTVGLAPRDLVASPLKGPKGNQEYLLWLVPAAQADVGPRLTAERIEELVARFAAGD